MYRGRVIHTQMKTLTPKGRPDNFLLEMELALAHAKRGHMAILPVMIGRGGTGDEPYVRYSGFNTSAFPETRSPTRFRGTVRQTIEKIFKLSALKLLTPLPTDEDFTEIVDVLERLAWLDTKETLKVRTLRFLSFFLFFFGCVICVTILPLIAAGAPVGVGRGLRAVPGGGGGGGGVS